MPYFPETLQSLALVLSPLPEFNKSNATHYMKIYVLHDTASKHFSYSSVIYFQHKCPYLKTAEATIKIRMDGPYSDIFYLVTIWGL